MQVPHRVLLIGSNNLLWSGLRAALSATPDVRVVGDTLETAVALHQTRASSPDLILVESTDTGARTAELVLALRTCRPEVKLVVVADGFQPLEFIQLATSGVQGYILWRDLDLATLRHCLHSVIQGELIVASRSVPGDVLFAQVDGGRSEDGRIVLNERERDILSRLAEGLTQKEIAAASGLSVRTVKRVVAELQSKLDAPSPFVLGVKAWSLGLVPPTP